MTNPTPCRLIPMPAGTTRNIEFNVTYSSDWSVSGKRGQNIEDADVGSAVFLLKRRLTDADADADITKTKGAGITITSGKATVLLDAANTADLQGEYFATLRLFLAAGGVQDFEDTDYDNVPYIMLKITQGAVEAVA